MSALGDFLVFMLLFSGALYGAAWVFSRFDPRAEQWSALWVACLGLSAFVPLSGVILGSIPGVEILAAADMTALHLPLGLLAPPELTTSAGTAPPAAPLFDWVLPAIAAIYLFGVVFSLVKLALGRRHIRTLVSTASLLTTVNGIDVRLSPRAHSPFAYVPVWRPRRRAIILPEAYVREMDRQQLDDIVAHEAAHVRRGDDQYGLVLRILMALCWVSPPVHGLFARWSQSTEIQCDMAVTAGRTPAMRKAYAETLLQVLSIMAGRVRQYPAASFSTHRLRNEKMRITHIVNGTRPAFKRLRDRLALTVLAGGLALIGTVSIAATSEPENDPGNHSPQIDKSVTINSVEVNLININPVKANANAVDSEMISGKLSARYGKAPDPFTKGKMRDHKGIDIVAPLGTPVYAPASGVIMAATDVYKNMPAYGTVVVLVTDGDVMTMFAHLDGYDVEAGQRVAKGEQIATVGSSGKSTGPHVHIETFKAGARVDPMTVWTFKSD